MGGGDPIEHAARVQSAARQQFHDWRRSFSPNVSPEDRRDSANWFTTSDAAQALKPALDAARAHADEAQATVDAAVKGQRVDTTDVAAQLAADRFWRRTERTLDSIKDQGKLVSAARDLIANATDAELPVINEELSAYLSSRGISTAWLNSTLAQRVPGVDDLRDDAALKSKRVAVLRLNHNGLVKAFANGTPAPELVDPYSPSITPAAYTNGEPFDPSGQ
ncbi:hypothetical protein A5708_24780 [Mycobacterium colombiense]|uniref:Uncharacterized protein n=1 Tax=Mycobacterium colombiense TaxID=339268 RepID=A0A1A2YTX8_9MYCO|nr:hypothetical protein A5708_24780 [Mycobacterium colombiense]